MRSVEEILSRIKNLLVDTPLAGFKPYSNLYALFRAFAGVIVELEQQLENIKTIKSEDNATGTDLDRIASEYGLYRIQGSTATGSALMKTATPQTVVAGTIFQSKDGTQLRTLSNLVFTNNGEIAVQLESVEAKYISIEAGAVLTANVYPGINCVVGVFRDSNGNPLIGIFDGTNQETDSELRSRIKLLKVNWNSKELKLQNRLLNIDGVSRVYISNSNPVPGALTIYLNSKNQRVLSAVRLSIEDFKEPGILVIVKSIDYYYVEIDAQIAVNNLADTGVIDSSIKSALQQYVESLGLVESLEPNTLTSIILSQAGVRNAVLGLPTQTINITNKLFKVSNINLTYSA